MFVYSAESYSFVHDDNSEIKRFLNKDKSLIDNVELSRILKSIEREIIKQDYQFLSVFISSKLNNSKDFSLDISSDFQYLNEDILYAEGNVKLLFSDAILEGDKISYDKKKKY